MVEDQVSAVYAALDARGIPYQRYDHPAVFTAEDAAAHWAPIPARGIKNLFLRNKKGNRHYLVIVGIEKDVDLRQLVKVLGDDRLSFASAERLMEHLGLTPGSVSPFGLLADTTQSVRVVVDGELREAAGLIFHPNLNTHSVTISGPDLDRFLRSTGHVVSWLAL